MIDNKFIIPECYGDTALIECLGYSDPNHQKGVGNVLNALEKKGYRDRKVVCIIDNDKKLPKLVRSMRQLKEENGLKMLQHENGLHHFIIVHPALDYWIFNCSKLADIHPTAYSIPDDFKDFKNYVKRKDVDQDADFVLFLKAIKKFNPKPFSTLKSWLDEFMTNQWK